MKVWAVLVGVFNNDLARVDGDVYECGYDLYGVYDTEEKARAVQEKLIDQNAHEMIAFECDPIDVVVTEEEVQ